MMELIHKGLELLGMPHVVRCARRSSRWPAVEKAHLKQFPACVVCGDRKRKKQVHHIDPVHYAPDRELDPTNHVTVCAGDCHLIWGHNGAYKLRNLNLLEDIAAYEAERDAARIEYQNYPFPRPDEIEGGA